MDRMHNSDQEAEQTEGGRGYGWDGDGNGINMWEDTVAKLILGTEPNATLASAPGLELHQPTMSMLIGNVGWLDRERERAIKTAIY